MSLVASTWMYQEVALEAATLVVGLAFLAVSDNKMFKMVSVLAIAGVITFGFLGDKNQYTAIPYSMTQLEKANDMATKASGLEGWTNQYGGSVIGHRMMVQGSTELAYGLTRFIYKPKDEKPVRLYVNNYNVGFTSLGQGLFYKEGQIVPIGVYTVTALYADGDKKVVGFVPVYRVGDDKLQEEIDQKVYANDFAIEDYEKFVSDPFYKWNTYFNLM